MAEYEASRLMPVASEIVFDVAAQLSLLDRWIPASVRVHVSPEDLPVVHAENGTVGRPREVEGLFRADPDQRRLEWGTRGDDRYAGWLQVADANAGMSETTVHLSIRDDERVVQSDFDVPGELEHALQRLADDVTTQTGGSSAG